MDEYGTADKRAVIKMLGGKGAEERAQHDYYATPPKAVELLLGKEVFAPEIWEPACGEGHIAKVLTAHGYTVRATDLIDRNYGEGGIDFLLGSEKWDGDIMTNPPYSLAVEFVRKAIDSVPQGHKIAMFLRLNFLEGKARRKLFDEYPPKTVYVCSSRQSCGKNGDFRGGTNAVAYAWFVWQKGFKGSPQIDWIG